MFSWTCGVYVIMCVPVLIFSAWLKTLGVHFFCGQPVVPSVVKIATRVTKNMTPLEEELYCKWKKIVHAFIHSHGNVFSIIRSKKHRHSWGWNRARVPTYHDEPSTFFRRIVLGQAIEISPSNVQWVRISPWVPRDISPFCWHLVRMVSTSTLMVGATGATSSQDILGFNGWDSLWQWL